MTRFKFVLSGIHTNKRILSAFIIFAFLSIGSQVLGADILFITGTRFYESDAAIRDSLENRGFEVTVIPDDEVQVADGLGRDLVVISESVYSRRLNSTFRNLPVPIIVSEPWLFGDMGLTGSTPFVDFGRTRRQSAITLNNLQHTLTAGMTAGAVSISYRNTAMGWGVPGPGALKIASLDDDPAKCTVFAYDKEDEMAGLTAPAKRIGFFLYRKTAAYLTAEGWALFQAAVDWALAPEPSAPVTIKVLSDESWKTCAGEGCEIEGWPGVANVGPNWIGAETMDAYMWYLRPGFEWGGPGIPSEAFFHTTLNLPFPPSSIGSGLAYVACPGSMSLYINGSPVIENASTIGEGGGPRGLDIRKYLKENQNVIAIYADCGESFEKYVYLDITIEAETAPARAAGTDQALLVVGRTPLRFGDLQLKKRLERLGYLVYLVDDDRVAETDGANKSLIVISESVWSDAVGEAFSRVAVPLICFESYLYDDLKMTGPVPNKDYGKTRRQRYIHFLGFGDDGLSAATPQKIKIANRRQSLGWGVPQGSALIAATLADHPERAAIFAYEKDAPMAEGEPAPAGRIGMFLHRNTSKWFTEQGWELFDAAVEWVTTEE